MGSVHSAQRQCLFDFCDAVARVANPGDTARARLVEFFRWNSQQPHASDSGALVAARQLRTVVREGGLLGHARERTLAQTKCEVARFLGGSLADAEIERVVKEEIEELVQLPRHL